MGVPERMNFLCDAMLGKLCRQLRILGLDAHYCRSAGPDKLVSSAAAGGRTLLTRRSSFRRNPPEVPYLLIDSNDPVEQLAQVVHYFRIRPSFLNPFSRCIVCNRTLEQADHDSVEGRVPDYVFNTVEAFSRCPDCGRIYWKGTHYSNMTRHILSMALKCCA